MLLASCGPGDDASSRSAFRRGAEAVLQPPGAVEIPLGIDREASRAVAQALAARDQSRLAEILKKGDAVLVPAGTRVKVLDESSSERRISLLEGTLAGHEGWVPIEWLTPVRR